ncbi:ferredoxin--NADP reductase [Thermodesulforhabdus norvegica]|uniref:Ferredoxin-NADP reductase n=1 Tax=Thermodesulforhabdus norvegica TaxID=39841 RepID=A0A1I4RBV5_9BACT|nr:FAD-dependent oxidoreductase [Thermodesulforhabdus norvegica]SFM49784.1 Ferredoxin-NADP reductase [Thermodesulforhabdus norvegica]
MGYSVRVVDRVSKTGTVAVLKLEKPRGFAFKPGQWTVLSLPEKGFSDEKGLARPLSIASAPFEDFLLFATGLSESAFKKTLQRLSAGDEVFVDDPRGNLVFPEEAEGPVVMIAGGVGITPFRSMVLHALKTGWTHPLALFYSSKTPEEAVFLQEFFEWSGRFKNFTFVPTMTRVSPGQGGWDGETGRVSVELIGKHFDSWRDAIYFVAGPPSMVDATQKMLAGMGIVQERIKLEGFGTGR